jgi:hypothetical protein
MPHACLPSDAFKKKLASQRTDRRPRAATLIPIIILQPSITASIITDSFAYASGASTAFPIMSRKGRSSDSRRCQWSDGRHSNMSDRSASVAFDTASTHPSISDGWTSIPSTNATTPSDISMDFGPNPPPVQPQGPSLGFGASLPPHSQAAFDGQQMDPSQDHYSQPDPYHGYYAAPGYDAASSAEATGQEEYGSPGNNDDLANSTLASYGSPPPPSPPW